MPNKLTDSNPPNTPICKGMFLLNISNPDLITFADHKLHRISLRHTALKNWLDLFVSQVDALAKPWIFSYYERCLGKKISQNGFHLPQGSG